MSRRARAPSPALLELARLRGVETAYRDASGRRREATAEPLVRVLRALGSRLDGPSDAPRALAAHREALARRPLEPVAVAWDGRPGRLRIGLSADGGPADVVLRIDSGRIRRWRHRPGRSLSLPAPLPPGYHRLTIRASEGSWETLVISAPRRAFVDPRPGRTWGVFLPLHALHSRRSWGAGDLGDLGRLAEWVGGLGGRTVAVLPLLAALLDEPFDPSPYAPASRLFWNEFFVDAERAPEMRRCPEARSLLRSPEFRAERDRLRGSPLVDYRAGMALKRGVLEALARSFFDSAPPPRRAALPKFLGVRPEAADYARFRAAVERHGPWPSWPARMREGDLRPGDFDEEAARYHLYVQLLAHEQLRALSAKGRRGGAGLALDLPLGVHPLGYDAWRHRDLFAEGVSTGAPPDDFFTKGQNWGFAPLHPERIRERGYGYLIACLRHHLRFASVLRIDHAMSLHRLFWIPDGMAPKDGVYVRYRAEELYAILCLESHRNRAVLVGEDLGTVPPEVRPAMDRRAIHRMHVLQLEASPRRPPRRPSPLSQASLNTHDMPTFAAFWEGLDLSLRSELGLLKPREARAEARRRRAVRDALIHLLKREGRLEGGRTGPETGDALRACLAHLAASPARMVLVNLEDLWLETRPQNVPGTGPERPNWRRKARCSFEEFTRMEEVVETLKEMDKWRRREGRR